MKQLPSSILRLLIPALFTCIPVLAYSQTPVPTDTLKKDSTRFDVKKPRENLKAQYDVGDLYDAIFHPKKKLDSVTKRSAIVVIPNVAANPTIGAQIGIKAVAGKVLGNEPGTFMSVAATSASITTKNIIYFYINHNVFTPGNRWNLQGSLVAAKTVTPDFGMGIGNAVTDNASDAALTNPSRKGYAYNARYYNIREKVYKEVGKSLFLGAGISFDTRQNIAPKSASTTDLTPYNVYSDAHGFDRSHYIASGLLFNVQYTTRDNQNRAYKGIYADAGFRINQTWLASSKNAVQFTVDLRKYISLSSEHPEHVIALWTWGSYVLSGDLPYLEMPGSGKDPNFRSARGYTVAYFKGTQYQDAEVEYRFPILRNKFLSGVAFGSMQTTNDDAGTKIFSKWQPGGGAGLRVLFNKATRTNLCLDYAFGKYGSRGFFLGLNEAF